jgi:hypothetical protein
LCLACVTWTGSGPVGAAQIPAYVAIDLLAGDTTLASGAARALDHGQISGVIFSPEAHATLWPAPGEPPVDLNPTGWIRSAVTAASGGRQVGYIATTPSTSPDTHAALWSGTADSAVDLHPQGFARSFASGISGTQQVGWGTRPGSSYGEALVWTGTAASIVSLHPAGAWWSLAQGVWNGQQVGLTGWDGSFAHATLWSGTASSAVDLHPAGYWFSEASGIAAGQQVGIAIPDGSEQGHAMLWTGTAASAVDLDPGSAGFSHALATNGVQQVGVVQFLSDGPEHAALWSGTADSFVDLGAFLPAGKYGWAEAIAIDGEGNVVGVAEDLASQRTHPILWRVVPEPGAAGFLALAAARLLLVRRRFLGVPWNDD